MIDLNNITIEKAHESLKNGEYTVTDLVNAYLDVIKEENQNINAYLEVYSDVLDQAKIAEKMFSDGTATLMTGIPIALKDNILFDGHKVSASSKILENYKATYDADIIKQLKSVGTVFIGRVNMDEFAMGSSTETSAYGNTKNPFTAGSSLYGNRNASGQFPFATTDTAGGLYGAGRFTYTTNQFSSSVWISGSNNGGTTPTLSANTGSVVTASWAEIGYDSAYSASVVANGIYKVTLTTASLLTNFDPDAVRGFVLSGSGFAPSNLLPQFTTYNYTAGTIAFFFTGSTTAFSGAPAATVTVFYQKMTADNNRGDFEDGSNYSEPNAASATSIVIPEINISMQSQAIVAKTKKLKATWTPEFSQDLNATQALDVEAELTSIMSEYISLEIDLEILDMLIQDAAAGTEVWSVVNNTTITSPNAPAATLGFYNTQGTWFQTLGTKIQKLSNKIHQLTLRGGANFMVVSPTVATIIESIPGYASSSDGDVTKAQYAFGVQKAGQLNSRLTVYKNPYMTENTILLGFRGTQFLEAGAVFAPYIPLIMTPLVYNPDTYTPGKGLLTRFAKKMLRPEFYGKIYVNGLNTL